MMESVDAAHGALRGSKEKPRIEQKAAPEK